MPPQRRQAVGVWIYDEDADTWTEWDGRITFGADEIVLEDNRLSAILKQMKIANMHLAYISGLEIEEYDVEV